MFEEKRGAPRTLTEISLEVSLCSYKDEQECILAGPENAVLLDVSISGAGIAVPKIKLNSHHFFYGPQDDDNQYLRLSFSSQEGNTANIAAMPVWFNKEIDEEPNHYRLGLKFISSPEDPSVKMLNRIAKNTKRGIGSWLNRLLQG